MRCGMGGEGTKECRRVLVSGVDMQVSGSVDK